MNSGERFHEMGREMERDSSGGIWVLGGDPRGALYRCEGSPYEEIHSELSAVINGCTFHGSVRPIKAIMLGSNSLNGLLLTPSTVFVLTPV